MPARCRSTLNTETKSFIVVVVVFVVVVVVVVVNVRSIESNQIKQKKGILDTNHEDSWPSQLVDSQKKPQIVDSRRW